MQEGCDVPYILDKFCLAMGCTFGHEFNFNNKQYVSNKVSLTPTHSKQCLYIVNRGSQNPNTVFLLGAMAQNSLVHYLW